MLIKKIRFTNDYKRFHDLTIDLGENPARIVALVGPNGCGKSSVLDGILHHANAHGILGDGSSRDHRYHSSKGQSDVWQNITITLTTGRYSDEKNRRRQIGKENTLISFRSPYRYNSDLKISETRSVPEIKENSYGASDASSLDAKMENSYRRLYAKYNKHRDDNDLKPSEAKAEIIQELNDSIKTCLDLEISSLGNVEGNRGTLYFTKKDHDDEFEFNVLSSGEKEVVDILLDLYLRQDDYDDTVFLIDEPELHISTSIQSKLLKEIDNLVGENCQIWLTTHSIGFLRALQTDMKDRCQIIHFRPEYRLAAETYTLHPISIGPGTWRELFSIALDDLANLVSPTCIVYCEGRAEPGPGRQERGMDAQVFNNIFARTRPDTFFTSSGGNTEPDQRSSIAIAILGKVFPTIEILVLKDRDMGSGKKINESDRQVYLKTNAINHRVLKRWEIENYIFDKEVLKRFCSQNGLTFDEESYEKYLNDIENQNVKDDVQRIKNFCGVKGSISPESFKIELSNYFDPSMDVYKELEAVIFDRQ